MGFDENDHGDLAEALEHIDPAALDYQQWVDVGMGLHASGLPMELWDGWSRRDPGRYREGECERKWRGFGHSERTVGSGTVAKMAMDAGWRPSGSGSEDSGQALGWNDTIDVAPARPLLDPSWVDGEDLPAPAWGEGAEECARYLTALFADEEIVGYVCDSWDNDGRKTPRSRGVYTRTAGELVRDLKRYGNVAMAIGAYDREAGAWVRFNPLDGEGVGNADVTEFRYALVESDSMPKEKQWAIIRQLELPCAAVVDSGGKSVHAIVKVDARDYGEYRERVEALYKVCRDNGLDVDGQNKNPSRLSRLPGFERGDGRQRLLAVNCGRKSWAEWMEWMQEETDDLPDMEDLADVWDDMPDLAPELIHGVLRQGHKMLMAGPSKAGKSFALIELCIAIATGGEWLGFRCAKGRVVYVNLELDRPSALHRFKDVYSAMGGYNKKPENITVWNLRGCAAPMDRLAPSLIRRALRVRPLAIVIDPIYKVITGDENAADQMAAFCNQFDAVARQVGCAVIYCHHHSKGAQGQKRSMDRASGSGVFARDPDALIDLAPIQLEPGTVRPSPGATAWRVEGTLREFESFEPVDAWFDWPLHRVDETGALAGLPVEGEEAPPVPRKRRKRAENGVSGSGDSSASQGVSGTPRDRARAEKVAVLREGLARCAEDGAAPTREAVAGRCPAYRGEEVTRDDVREWTRSRTRWCPIDLVDGLLVDREDPGEAIPWE